MAHPLTEEDVKAGRRMTQARSDESMDTASKIKRLRKLRAHFHPEARATGNPKEAALARKIFDRLLLRWGLSLAEVEKGKPIARTFEEEFEAVLTRAGLSYRAVRQFRIEQMRVSRRDAYANWQQRNPRSGMNAWYDSFKYGFTMRFTERIGVSIRAHKPEWWRWDEYGFASGQQAANAFPLTKVLNP